MNTDPASLDNLRDIVELPPAPWWPLAPGWWAVIVALMFIALAVVVYAWNQRKANAYRRTALQELASAKTVAAIDGILKRTALCAFPRIGIASLSGHDWCQWLQETSGVSVPPTVVRTLTEGIYRDHEPADTAETQSFARHWIMQHRTGPPRNQAQRK